VRLKPTNSRLSLTLSDGLVGFNAHIFARTYPDGS